MVACRIATQLHASKAVAVSGVLTICSPLAGVPLLGHISEHYPALRLFLQNVRTYAVWDPRRILGEFVRVEEWIWDEMAFRQTLARPDVFAGCAVLSAGAGQDVIVPVASALAAARQPLRFSWASHYNLLMSRRACERLVRAVLALLSVE